MTLQGPRGPAAEFVLDDDASRMRARSVARRRVLGSLALVAAASMIVSGVSAAGQQSLRGADSGWVRTSSATSQRDALADGLDADDGDATATPDARPAAGATTGATGATTTTTVPEPSEPAIVARPIPDANPSEPPPSGPAPPWADATIRTPAGHVATPVGCAGGTSAPALDAFFRERMGPVVGHDYQHVYALGGDRSLWIFQDTFIDHTGQATRLDQASFAHNTAMVQDGDCFTVLHRGTPDAPQSFEPGTGEQRLRTWFWPMGGETSNGRLQVFWAQMAKRPDPGPPDGLGWDPVRTWIATYDASTLARLDFAPAPDDGVAPIYGYAVSSDDTHSYLFGNSFDQRLSDQGGFFGGPHSARQMFLARVPKGQLHDTPEYWDGVAWSPSADRAVPISDRFSPENPMQPRYLGGQWVAVTKAGGYWGEELVIDVAAAPHGPWLTVSKRYLAPRGGDPAMNTYHAHLMPWLANGSLVISVSQNARDMLADAWPHPERYRLQFLGAPLVRPEDAPPQTTPTWPAPAPAPPAPPATTRPTTTSSTTPSTTATTSTTSTTSTTTTSTSTSTTSTTVAPPTTPASTTTLPACSTTTSTAPSSSSSTSSTTSTSTTLAGTTTSTIPTCTP